MNEEMRQAWLEISQMLGEPTREELDVFMRTWQRAVQATRRTLAEQPAQPYKGIADHINQATNGRMRIDPVTGDVGIGTPSQQPAQRPWVGLTHKEVEEVWKRVEASDFRDVVQPFARAIEAALRSKNA